MIHLKRITCFLKVPKSSGSNPHQYAVTVVCHNSWVSGKLFRQMPSPDEVMHLNNRYKEPYQIVHTILEPVQSVDINACPTLQCEKRMNGRIWKVLMKFSWPRIFKVVSESSNIERAEHYAFLSACDMFYNLGLLSKKGEVIDYRQKLEQAQEEIFTTLKINTNLCFESSREVVDSRTQWICNLRYNWPFYLNTTGKGLTQEAAERNASLLGFILLKATKKLDRKNVIVLPHESFSAIWKPFVCQDRSNGVPDFELFVDASRTGYGAYLVNKDNSSNNDSRVRWIQESYPDNDQLLHDLKNRDYSAFLEFYALLGCLFTWKKKFVGKNILCWCDNVFVVDMINNGLNLKSFHQRNFFTKIYKVLQDTCVTYQIYLHAKHLGRMDNQAADHLSRANVEEFQEMVPNTYQKAKKSKKLLFFRPIVDYDHENSSREIVFKKPNKLK